MLTIALLAATLSVGPAPSLAQVRTIDPNQAIDSDLQRPQSAPTTAPQPAPQTTPGYEPVPASDPQAYPPYNPSEPGVQANGDGAQAVPSGPNTAREDANANAAQAETFKREEILSAAEGTFGKGAAGLAGILERTLKQQGEPNAYISGREAAGAIAIGLRYGKGTMFHKVEGEMPVYWSGPSLGFDLGGDATKVFVLVYNLYDSEELFHRFPAGEGRLYFIGGFAATYLRRGNTVLIPIRLGVGWRQGVNIGYMKFTHKSRWFPL
ncbi:MAG: EipA family protein [Sphingomonas bacterium]